MILTISINIHPPAGTVYKGGFKGGEFHGEGSLTVPGFGTYSAIWDNGKEIKGGYTFSDGLKYSDENWKYCSASDRRFYNEIQEGIRPAGTLHKLNLNPPNPISNASNPPPSALLLHLHLCHRCLCNVSQW